MSCDRLELFNTRNWNETLIKCPQQLQEIRQLQIPECIELSFWINVKIRIINTFRFWIFTATFAFWLQLQSVLHYGNTLAVVFCIAPAAEAYG